MFAKGTKIMYGNTGVCEVMDYATPDLPGMPRGTKYYVLRPLFQSGTIYCPVEQPKVFMRPVMSREEAEELVALIPTISVEPFHTGRLQELSEHYRSIIGTHSTTDLVEIIKSVYSKKREAEAAGRRVSQMDDRYMTVWGTRYMAAWRRSCCMVSFPSRWRSPRMKCGNIFAKG